MLTQQRLKELIHYDPATGVFTWNVVRGPKGKGSTVGQSLRKGKGLEKWVVIDKTRRRLSDMAFLFMTGEFPSGVMCFLDTNRSNLAWSNLKEVVKQSPKTTRLISDKTKLKSGYKGVYWHKQIKKWTARITFNSRSIYLGVFSDPKDGARAYNDAALKYVGVTAILNRL